MPEECPQYRNVAQQRDFGDAGLMFLGIDAANHYRTAVFHLDLGS